MLLLLSLGITNIFYSKNEKGADADWVINKMMDGERGSLKGLRHLLGEQIIRKSKYFREQGYEFQVSMPKVLIKPEETVFQ